MALTVRAQVKGSKAEPLLLYTDNTRLFFLEKEDDDPQLLHLGVTHASLATNCSVLNHPIGSIMDVPIY